MSSVSLFSLQLRGGAEWKEGFFLLSLITLLITLLTIFPPQCNIPRRAHCVVQNPQFVMQALNLMTS